MQNFCSYFSCFTKQKEFNVQNTGFHNFSCKRKAFLNSEIFISRDLGIWVFLSQNNLSICAVKDYFHIFVCSPAVFHIQMNSQGEIGNDSLGTAPATDASPKYIILPILCGWNLYKHKFFFVILNSPENTVNMLYLFNLLLISVISLKNNYVNKVVLLYPFLFYQMLYSVLSYKFQLGTFNLLYSYCSFLGRRYVTLTLKSNLLYV